MIDWTRVDELRREVGEEDFPEVVEIFLEEVDEVFTRLPESAANESLSEDLHFLKGSAASLGFAGLTALCATGERLCTQGNAAAVSITELKNGYLAEREEFLARFRQEAA